jgi:hypothetical protein
MDVHYRVGLDLEHLWLFDESFVERAFTESARVARFYFFDGTFFCRV